MTDQKEVLELAMGKFNASRIELFGIEIIAFPKDKFHAFASALREQDQAQVAMLVDAIENGDDVVVDNYSRRAIPLEVALAVVSATQQTADAFLAEVRAKALEDAANKIFVLENGWGEWSIQHAQRDLRELAADLRQSAAQPEAKGSPCVGCMYYTDSTGSWVFACPKCTKKAAQPEVNGGVK